MARFATGRRTQSGFTLVELMTSVVVLVLVIAAIGATFIGVQQTYQLQAQTRSAIENGRTGNSYLAHMVRMAGYGLEPMYAFDFATAALPGTTKSNYATGSQAGRDLVITDDLAYRYRDPAYAARGSLDVPGTTLTLDGVTTFGTPIKVGQALLIACNGAQRSLMVRAQAAAVSTANAVSVAAAGGVFAGGIFGSSNACMVNVTGANAPYVMIVHEERIRAVNLSGRPYLVVFHNFNAPNPAVNTDFDPIAADVENFQVAYVMNRPVPGGLFTATVAVDGVNSGSPPNPNWVMGDEGSGSLEIIPDPAITPAPNYDMGYDSAARYTKHPSNIRAVRTTLVIRSARPLTGSNARGVTPYNVEDYTFASPVSDGYFRTSSTATTRIPNMLGRAFFTPLLQPSGGDPNLNTGGS